MAAADPHVFPAGKRRVDARRPRTRALRPATSRAYLSLFPRADQREHHAAAQWHGLKRVLASPVAADNGPPHRLAERGAEDDIAQEMTVVDQPGRRHLTAQ